MPNREYPQLPMVGVGGVVISGDRVLLARRGAEPLRGEWSIPGGLLEAGETIEQGVARELLEETGLTVRVVALIEALDRIFFDPPGFDPEGAHKDDPVRTPQIDREATPGRDPARAPIIDPSVAPGRDLERMSARDPEGAPEFDANVKKKPATRIARPDNAAMPADISARRPKYHYVILDYLCEVAKDVADEAASAEPRAGGDVTEVAFVREDDLPAYRLNPKTLEVIAKAFAMARARH